MLVFEQHQFTLYVLYFLNNRMSAYEYMPIIYSVNDMLVFEQHQFMPIIMPIIYSVQPQHQDVSGLQGLQI